MHKSHSFLRIFLSIFMIGILLTTFVSAQNKSWNPNNIPSASTQLNLEPGKPAPSTPGTSAPVFTMPAKSVNPTIDGIISAGEWTDAYALDPYHFWGADLNMIYLKNDACFIFMASVLDGTVLNGYGINWMGNWSNIVIWYDLDKDGQWDMAGDMDGAIAMPYPFDASPMSQPGLVSSWVYPCYGNVPCNSSTYIYMPYVSQFTWYPSPGIWLTAPDIDVNRTLISSTIIHVEAKLNVQSSPLKVPPGQSFNIKFNTLEGSTAAQNGYILAEWPNNWNYYYAYPYATGEVGTTFVPMGADPFDIISFTLPTTTYVYTNNSSIQINISGQATAPPYNDPYTIKLIGPLPGATTYTFSGTLAFTTGGVENKTLTISLVGIPKGFYNLEAVFADPTACGPSNLTKKYVVMILNPGEIPCYIYPGDLNNDNICNLQDARDFNLYVYNANLRSSWLEGPARRAVGELTATSSPMDIFKWIMQAGVPWASALGCYMDADGNGRIQSTGDLWGVKINLGKTHAPAPKDGAPVAAVPFDFNVYQNYPNPFNPTTNITYDMPEESFVTLKVTDANGREVRTLVQGNLNAGSHQVSFNATDLTSGVYYYTITMRGLKTGNDFSKTMKMLLTK